MHKHRIFITAILLFVIIVGLTWFLLPRESDSQILINETSVVVRLIDLDTFELTNGLRVRLLCINAPEREQPWTSRAQAKIAALVVGSEVILEKDVSDNDDYARLLRHIYLKDGTWIQDFIVRSGFARLQPYEPDTEKCGLLEEARREAEQKSLGIWAAKIPICDRDVYDCDDFADKRQAEALFSACGGPMNDIHGLDGDKDGDICEELNALTIK